MNMNPNEELRWRKFEVLDDGFVCLVDWMGDDAAITQAARVCYGEGTKSVSDDRTLIRYLMRHRHWTPFEMAEVKFLIRMPMDAWRQMVRHRTASINEHSTRYSVAIDSMRATDPQCWRSQSTENRQGSGDGIPHDLGVELSREEAEYHRQARRLYEKRIELGVAREQARKDLPLSTYTEAYWKVDLRNLFHYLSLRMAPDAQQEIRRYADVIGHHIVSRLFPLAWEAFLDYQLHAMTLSARERDLIRALARNHFFPLLGQIPDACLPVEWQGERCRERDECFQKLCRLGLAVPAENLRPAPTP